MAIEPGRVSEPITSASGSAAQWPELESTLELVMMYEDAQSQMWTRQLSESLARALGKDAVHATGWKIGDLGTPGALAEAVVATTRADVVVIALNAAEELPLEAYIWVDAWLPRRPQIKGILVGLVAVPEESGALGWQRTENYLNAVARKADLEYLIQRCEQRQESPAGAMAGSAGNGAEISLFAEAAYTHWGLNE